MLACYQFVRTVQISALQEQSYNFRKKTKLSLNVQSKILQNNSRHKLRCNSQVGQQPPYRSCCKARRVLQYEIYCYSYTEEVWVYCKCISAVPKGVQPSSCFKSSTKFVNAAPRRKKCLFKNNSITSSQLMFSWCGSLRWHLLPKQYKFWRRNSN